MHMLQERIHKGLETQALVSQWWRLLAESSSAWNESFTGGNCDPCEINFNLGTDQNIDICTSDELWSFIDHAQPETVLWFRCHSVMEWGLSLTWNAHQGAEKLGSHRGLQQWSRSLECNALRWVVGTSGPPGVSVHHSPPPCLYICHKVSDKWKFQAEAPKTLRYTITSPLSWMMAFWMHASISQEFYPALKMWWSHNLDFDDDNL